LQIVHLIHERGPVTVAAFMEHALYHPQLGYYARAARRSGRSGDFFTSTDVGPIFGELLAEQVAEMARILAASGRRGNAIDLVEAGAGNGQLASDILGALRERHRDVYDDTRLHLVEVSGAARAAQAATLAENAERLASSSASLPDRFTGVLIANELVDAMPVHQIVMREDGPHEIYVVSDGHALTTCEGPLSTQALADHLARQRIELEPGWRAEINLKALDWVRDAAARLESGFVILIDYGHSAAELYSPSHASGTLTTFSHHHAEAAGNGNEGVPWLSRPGHQDITAHVDFTSLRTEMEAAGLRILAFLDQTYFLMGLAQGRLESLDFRQRRALKTLLMPGGLGSTMKVLVAGKAVGRPELSCCSFGTRAT
jgi:SAM-dependent MidA family methyltransferase